MAAPAHAHDGAPLLPHDLWSAWSLDPLIVIPMLLTGLLYARGVTALWQAAGIGRGVSRWQVASFAAGLAVLTIALISPLHALSETLFSAHMAQHMLLLIVAPPLLVWGTAPAVWWWAAPAGSRRDLAHWTNRQGWLHPLTAGLTYPLVVWTLSAAVLWLWHAPLFYTAALRNDAVHGLEHVTFLASALLLWWVLLPSARSRRVRPGVDVLLLFTAALQSSVLGALITFAPAPWYADYRLTAHIWGMTPLVDQQIAGIIMWGPMGLIYLAAALALLAARFAAWDTERQPVDLPRPAANQPINKL